jgi:hypothetical protein
VVCLRPAGRKRLRNGQHGSLLHLVFSRLRSLFREEEIAMDLFRVCAWRNTRYNEVIHLSLIETGTFFVQRYEGKGEARDVVTVL